MTPVIGWQMTVLHTGVYSLIINNKIKMFYHLDSDEGMNISHAKAMSVSSLMDLNVSWNLLLTLSLFCIFM